MAVCLQHPWWSLSLLTNIAEYAIHQSSQHSTVAACQQEMEMMPHCLGMHHEMEYNVNVLVAVVITLDEVIIGIIDTSVTRLS